MNRRHMLGVAGLAMFAALGLRSGAAEEQATAARAACACCGEACQCATCVCDLKAKTGAEGCPCCDGAACCTAKADAKACCAKKTTEVAQVPCQSCGEACGCSSCTCDVKTLTNQVADATCTHCGEACGCVACACDAKVAA